MFIRQVLVDFFDQSWFTLKFIDQMQKFKIYTILEDLKKKKIMVFQWRMDFSVFSFSPGAVNTMSDAKSYIIPDSWI